LENFVGLVVPKASENVLYASSPEALTRKASRSPTSPPASPHGDTFERSQSALTTISSASTVMTRVMPSPPRVRPGPPPSGFSLYSECSHG
jgi:hypothetical protein